MFTMKLQLNKKNIKDVPKKSRNGGNYLVSKLLEDTLKNSPSAIFFVCSKIYFLLYCFNQTDIVSVYTYINKLTPEPKAEGICNSLRRFVLFPPHPPVTLTTKWNETK